MAAQIEERGTVKSLRAVDRCDPDYPVKYQSLSSIIKNLPRRVVYTVLSIVHRLPLLASPCQRVLGSAGSEGLSERHYSVLRRLRERDRSRSAGVPVE